MNELARPLRPSRLVQAWPGLVSICVLSLGAALPLVACGGDGSDDATGGAPGSTGGSGTGTTGGWSPGLSTGGTTGSGTGTGTGSPPGPVPYSDVEHIVLSTCAVATCHGRDEEPLMLDDGSLPGVLTGTMVEECGNVPLVASGNADGSAIVLMPQRLCGDLVMPDGCRRDPCVADADLDVIRRWINEGASFE